MWTGQGSVKFLSLTEYLFDICCGHSIGPNLFLVCECMFFFGKHVRSGLFGLAY